MLLMLRDITQAYTQSKTKLNRLVLAHLPLELKRKYPKGTVLHVVQPLYGLAELGMHWFATYLKHHRDELDIETSSFNSCLLITKDGTDFSIVGMQTNDTLNVGTYGFMGKEEEKLQKAKFKTKPRTVLKTGLSDDFNGCHVKQIDCKNCGLRFCELDLKTAKLFIFVDKSFANNQDLSSQISYVIVLSNESNNNSTESTLTGNIIHYVLASKIYSMVSSFNIGYVLNHTLRTITLRLRLPKILLVLYTDSYSLY
ncbi:hypothetical protein K469DRAFT_725852 [Zopfia rhizophila CBS 207.26]|uniref:Reverse transcriptase Ty1/copia-type domain-containing protein n=1 Tax=Zopfia rhizophila CBS 207.26 TaxID=1314779 RepID=A0A6A6EU61_9PEZI|nr:hypothetical protein K469DRAFT_725852 [Zopfia rhizophila CBS 207.26]